MSNIREIDFSSTDKRVRVLVIKIALENWKGGSMFSKYGPQLGLGMI